MKIRFSSAFLVCLVLFAAVSFGVSAEEIGVTDESYFTFLWTTDPQWYSFKYFDIIKQQNQWVVDNYERLDIRYTFHTGDFVDLPHNTDQWDFMSEQYELWDDADIPYGICAGNHDVDGSDRTEFSYYFGKDRYRHNDWYGADYKDNYGHYDLMTCDGVDFVFVYLGYGEHTSEDYDWLNSVLKEHENRIAILNFHDYLYADGNRSVAGEALFENVILKNANVRLVHCGHNYNSVRRVDEVDDNGDGVSDRSVYQIMANYQNLENGGNGYMRFMECDIEGGRIICRTYSPYLNDYNAYDNILSDLDEYGYRDEFIIPFDFSQPESKSSSDPDKGSVVINAKAVFATPEGQAIILPLEYINTFESGNSYKNAGIYDRHSTMDASDAFSKPNEVNYVILRYSDSTGYCVSQVVSGSELASSSGNRVPVPERGAVIVIADGATDIDGNTVEIPIGSTVKLSQISGFDRPKEKTYITLNIPSWGESFYISDTNRTVGNDEWIIYDSLCGQATTGTVGNKNVWEMVFTFEPVEGSEHLYSLADSNTASGVEKDLKIPEGGFALAINSYTSDSSRRASMRKLLTDGLTVELLGYKPGIGIDIPGISLIDDSGNWALNGAIEVEVDDSTVISSSGNATAVCTLAHPISFDPTDAKLYYSVEGDENTTVSIALTLDNEEVEILTVTASGGDEQDYTELGTVYSKESATLTAVKITVSGRATLSALTLSAQEITVSNDDSSEVPGEAPPEESTVSNHNDTLADSKKTGSNTLPIIILIAVIVIGSTVITVLLLKKKR